MSSKHITIDLDSGNLEWLEERARSAGDRGVSEVLNQLLVEARRGGPVVGNQHQSVVGDARIHEDDPDLQGADAAIRALLLGSHDRYPPS